MGDRTYVLRVPLEPIPFPLGIELCRVGGCEADAHGTFGSSGVVLESYVYHVRAQSDCPFNCVYGDAVEFSERGGDVGGLVCT